MDFLDIIGISSIIDNIRDDFRDNFVIDKKEDKMYYSKEVKPIKFIYRPETLKEYIGQDNAKKLIELNIKKVQTLKPVHFCISGHKGAGKSTLANIIAKELNAKITWHIAGAFSKKSLEEFLIKNQDSTELQILFVDEGHNLQKELAEYLYPILEDFILPEGNNLSLKPFIFITATTEKNTLIKKFSPLVDRCGCDIVLEAYNIEDIMNILKQANDKLYQKNISEADYQAIASNSRFTPRIALSMLDDLIVSENINIVLSSRRIIKNSLTDIDIRILRHLAEVEKPVGIEALAMIAGITREDYGLILEPFLIYNHYLTRTARGRLISLKGKELLNNIKI